MVKSGPIVIVEDDNDDQELYDEIIKDLGISNKLVFFKKTVDAFHYLKTTPERTFIIFCDVNLPGQTGLNFKKQIDEDSQLRQASIPFVFISTDASIERVTEAYSKMTVQGFFKKPAHFSEFKNALTLILDYWKLCRHPNSDD